MLDNEDAATTTETEAPAPPAAPPEAPRVSPISARVAQARADLAAGKIPATLEEPEVTGEEVAEAPAEPAAPAPGAGTEPVEEAGAEEAAPAEEPVTEGDDPALIITLPPRNEGEEPREIMVEDPATAERLRMALRNGLRRDQYFAAMGELRQREEELARFEDEIAANPVLFVTEKLGEKHRVDAVMHLLSQPGVYEAVRAELDAWQYDDKRETAALRLKDQRNEQSRDWKQRVDSSARARFEARKLTDAIDRIVPDSLDDETAELLRGDLRRDAADYITLNRVASLHPGDLPRILGRRLKQYGIAVQDAEAALSVEGPPPVRGRTASGAAAKPAGRNAPPDAAAARQTGARLQAKVATRRAAAAVPGAGAGAPPAAPSLPAGQTIKERVKTLRQRLGAR